MDTIQDPLLSKINDILFEMGVERTAVTLEAHFMRDLGLDSLEVVDLMMSLEREFNMTISDTQMNDIRTVGQLVDFLHQQAVTH
ncbi:acyl carrier protein [Telluribacter humicola]|uniref:acyl carrier protein n=1 Tax=Telluribacter humicola TaxID=1720261 RepID=UPI001A964A94|nr:acyl carrier protein [Telluribacter humicola]